MKIEDMSFEDAMSELERVVAEMESGELSLELSLKQFERGIALTRHTQSLLKNAEQKVSILTKEANGDEQLSPFAE